jgi:hypothetical protein
MKTIVVCRNSDEAYQLEVDVSQKSEPLEVYCVCVS